MFDVPDNMPVLIGAGQSVFRGSIKERIFCPADIAAEACRSALADAGLEDAAAIDTVVVTRIFEDSSPFIPSHFGSSENLPAAVAKRLTCIPQSLIYADVGGQSPQRLLNEMAGDIQNGKRTTVLITGAEAMDLGKQAVRSGIKLDWTEEMAPEYRDVAYDDRGYGKPFTGKQELPNGINSPVLAYALIENALRAKQGHSVADHRKVMAQLFSRFSKVAAANDYAQYPDVKSAEFLAEETRENFAVTLPYTKWLVAQDSVNQGAAIIVTSAANARAMRIPEDHWVFLHGWGDADDAIITQREDLASVKATEIAAEKAFASAKCSIDDIALLDLYSCFPCAVLLSCEALGIDWQNDKRALTVTGGLPYFGGPGNNYSLHAMAEMVWRLRANTEQRGLVWANGGYLSKASVGIYSGQPPASDTVYGCEVFETPAAQRKQQELVLRAPASGLIESYTVSYKRGEPVFGCVIAALDNREQRLAARLSSEDKKQLSTLSLEEVIGRSVIITPEEKANYFTLN